MKNGKMIFILAVCLLLLPVVVSGGNNINNSSQFFKWLEETGTPSYSVSGSYKAGYEVFRDYNMVVYGGPQSIADNEYRDGEYRYLGYTFLESKYSNLEFPNDATGGNIPENWDYVNVSGAGESWDSLEQTIQKPYMLYTRLSGHGATTLTASDIGLARTRVQSPATWTNTGSIYTYKSNGYYATFNVDSMGKGTLSASMKPERNVIQVSKNMTVGLNVNASVNKPADEIEYMKVVFHLDEGDVTRFFPDTNSIEVSQNTTAKKPGNNYFSATVYAKSIFGDNLIKPVTCNVAVIETENTPVPTVKPTPFPTPMPTPIPTATPGPEEYDPVRSVDIRGDWNYWEDEPHRFLSLEKIHVRIRISGYARRIVIRMSGGLEEMQYTNSKGHTYDYSDDFFGYYVRFPQDSTIYPGYGEWGLPTAEWEYILPLCDETVGWDGVRKKNPCRMVITVFGRGDDVYILTVDDIDITGNVYELLHPQPSN